MCSEDLVSRTDHYWTCRGEPSYNFAVVGTGPLSGVSFSV